MRKRNDNCSRCGHGRAVSDDLEVLRRRYAELPFDQRASRKELAVLTTTIYEKISRTWSAIIVSMNGIGLVAVLLTLGGALMPLTARRRGMLAAGAGQAGISYLRLYALIALIFGCVCLALYWKQVVDLKDEILFGFGLFLAMVGGMFVQVLASNFKADRPLLDVAGDRLLYPLLFSVIVFYPIWAVAASAPKGFFVVHAAFLNGYFWEGVVAGARPPQPTNTSGVPGGKG